MPMKVENLRDLFVHELRDLHSAEDQILKALPKLEESASNQQLKNAFREHRNQTQSQVERLDTILSRMDVSPRGVTCKGIQGIIEEGEEALKFAKDPDVKDAALIAGAQRVEHYEMSAYGTACAYAKLLGDDDAVKLLSQTLNEEKETDKKLTDIAEKTVNVQAK